MSDVNIDHAGINQTGGNDLTVLRDKLRGFAAERDWEQFLSPKNLAMAMSVEASELVEHFQWLTEEQSKRLTDDAKREVSFEAADVLLYLLQLSDKLGIDLIAAAHEKMQRNAQKYPIETSRGTAKKYTAL